MGRRWVVWSVVGLLAATATGCRPEAASRPAKARTARFTEPKYTDKTPEEWLALLRHRNGQARQLAADSLVRYGSRSVPGLIQVVSDRGAGPARLAAARALGGIGHEAEPAVEALVEALADPQWDARDSAAEALGMIGRGEALSVSALTTAARDPDPILRMSCARALGRLKSSRPESIECLIAALEDSDTNVQAEAANALAAIGPPANSAVDALEKASRSETFVVAQAASEALRAIRGQ